MQARHLLKRLEDRKIHVELTPAARACSCVKATTRCTAPGRSSGRYSGSCSIRWRMRVLQGEFREGDRIVIDADKDAIAFRKGAAAAAV